ncbi:hypothetical protein AKJ36_00950 [candidate division MSBL1 archaeon SCGC-AAA259I07]|uniref:Uracil-DNA glycosylase-like domain-containing protein n=1 Tax=candidate division MSBL1 archaeon SCGC-AAA259I07 TaxID=1698266 RepID=A0A133UM79_9EURY|nr:hypothetical protein AKJ36_00950 [candidate division MSBL1 archaeon SCGC-AAA259I07]
MSNEKSLKQLKDEIKGCNECRNNRGAWFFPDRHGVSGFNGDDKIFFVGERPSTGEWDKANELFYKLLKEYNFENAHLTDVIKCRKEVGEEVTREEIGNCVEHFRKELEVVNPKTIVSLGDKVHSILKVLLPVLGEQNILLLKIWHYTYPQRFGKQDDYKKQWKQTFHKVNEKKTH